MRKVEDKYNKSKLDDERAQRLNENPEFWVGLEHLIGEHSILNQFANEEVKSTWIYPEEYVRKPIIDQVNMLHQIFLELSIEQTMRFINEILPNIPIPEDFTQWFGWDAWPRWEKIGSTYQAATDRILKVLAKTRRFHNYREGKLDSQYLQQQERSILLYEQMKAQQPGDIIIAPSQLGLRHRGRSTRRAIEVFRPNEVGHGWFSGAAMLLTHPEREVRWEQLHMDLPGDKYAPDGDGDFSRAPLLYFSGGQLETGPYWVYAAHGPYGSASWLVPQYPSLEHSNN
ncbi:MAG: hypothetical protein V1712_01755 [Patescibacteria group bacterium]